MNDNDEKYLNAKKRVEDVKGFYYDLTAYIIVNLMLFAINMLFSPGIWWFVFPLLFWGIGVIFHFLGIFVFSNKIFGKKWEEKKIKEYMEEE